MQQASVAFGQARTGEGLAAYAEHGAVQFHADTRRSASQRLLCRIACRTPLMSLCSYRRRALTDMTRSRLGAGRDLGAWTLPAVTCLGAIGGRDGCNGASFVSVAELVAHIKRFIKSYNDDARPDGRCPVSMPRSPSASKTSAPPPKHRVRPRAVPAASHAHIGASLDHQPR
jgi:hypothetical protein